MTDINSSLGFDASQAIASLKQLDAALDQMKSGAQGVIGALGGFGRAGRDTSNSLQRMGRDSKRAAKDLQEIERRSRSLTVSFETLARVAVTQIIVSGLAKVKGAFRDAVVDAIEFQRTVAEIKTIDADRTFNQIAGEVRRLSDAFNADLGDVGRGLYQTISNQVGNAAGQINVLTTSLKFSKAAVTTTEQAVNLLAGTINAFERDASDAEAIAAKFFKTIELGRTTGKELADAFGRVAPIAARVGVSIEELDAAFATITIGGVKTNEAATQISGALRALVKPTEAMKAAFQELGFASGEQLIQAFGLVGAYERLIETTDGSTSAIAKLVPRVRGLNAVLRLTSKDGSKKYQKALDEIIDANERLLEEKFQIVFETDAEKVTRDINRIKNLFTVELGQNVLKTTQRIFQGLGGVDTVINAFSSLGSGLGLVIGPLTLVAGGIAAVGLQSRIASKEVGLLGRALSGIALFGIAVSVGEFIGKQIKRALEAEDRARREFNAKSRKRIEETNTAEARIEKAKLDKLLALNREFLGDLRKLDQTKLNRLRERAASEFEIQKDLFDRLLKINKDFESDIRAEIKKTRDARDKSAQRQLDIQSRIDQEKFQQQLRKTQGEQAKQRLELQRSNRLISRAFKQLETSGGDPERIERARRSLEAAFDAAKDAESRAGDDPFALRKAEEQVLRVLNQMDRFERRSQQINRRREDVLAGAEDKVKENNRQLAKLFAEREKLSKFVSDGRLVQGEDLEKAKTRLKEVDDLIRKRLGSSVRIAFRLGDQLGDDTFKDFVRRFQDEFSKVELRRLNAAPQALQTLASEIQGFLKKQTFQIFVSAEGVQAFRAIAGAGADVTNLDQITKQQELAAAREKQRVDARKDLNIATQKLVSLQGEELNQLIRRIDADRTIIEEFPKIKKLQQEGRTLIKDLAIVSRQGTKLSKEETAAFNKRVTAFFAGQQKISAVLKARGLGLELERSTLDELVTNVSLVQTNLRVQEAAQRRLNELTKTEANDKRFLASISDSAIRKRQQELQTARQQAGTDQATLDKIAQEEQALQRILQLRRQILSASGRAGAPGGAVQPPAQFFGGFIRAFHGGMARYFQTGGFAKGKDTIPAMLSDGEFVTSTRRTRQFFSQLQAINAGVRPVFREQGGTVTNVGDINVTVQGGGSDRQTARAIAESLRREMRRGTSRLS